MNEFTKEELKYIRDTMVNIVEVYPDTELPYSIRDKIQRMIDNYCEHHWRTSAINAIYCVHCQKHVEYEE